MTGLEKILENKITAIEYISRNLAVLKSTNLQTRCEDISCTECKFVGGDCLRCAREWLTSEWEEPTIEIDWARVPIDTPILVSDDEKIWYRKHFAGLFDDRIRVWENGNTSWSSKEGMSFPWYYAKLARPEDIEKYRKR